MGKSRFWMFDGIFEFFYLRVVIVKVVLGFILRSFFEGEVMYVG